MKWLKRKLFDWVAQGEELQDEINKNNWMSESSVSGRVYEDCHTPDVDPTMNFKVYNANGGKIVEFRQYDRVKDQSQNKLYVIGEDEDFGDAIKKIAMMHLLSTGGHS